MKRLLCLLLLPALCLSLLLIPGCAPPREAGASPADTMRAMATVEASFSGGRVRELGSAVIYALRDECAILLTNYHVVAEEPLGLAETISVCFAADPAMPYSATLLGVDAAHDLAVLETPVPPNAVQATLCDSLPAMGDPVIALAAPGGHGLCAAAGIVSLPQELLTVYDLPYRAATPLTSLRCDITLGDGASGGGLFDSEGQLVGLLHAGGREALCGFSFAIPAAYLRAPIEAILAAPSGTALPALSLGATLTDTASGVRAHAIEPGSAAYVALKEGDIILAASINGGTAQAATSACALRELLLSCTPGDRVTFTVSRAGKKLTSDLTMIDAFYNHLSIQEAS